MEEVTYDGMTFVPYIKRDAIAEQVQRLAAELSRDYKDKKVLFLCVLNGSFIFAADLFRACDLKDAEITFVRFMSYDGLESTGEVKQLIGLNNSIEGRHIIVVEDIVDTGESIDHLTKALAEHNPASVEICTLFFKPNSYRKEIPIRYRAMEIGNEFIVGYGLDYDQLGRNLKDIYVVTE